MSRGSFAVSSVVHSRICEGTRQKRGKVRELKRKNDRKFPRNENGLCRRFAGSIVKCRVLKEKIFGKLPREVKFWSTFFKRWGPRIYS